MHKISYQIKTKREKNTHKSFHENGFSREEALPKSPRSPLKLGFLHTHRDAERHRETQREREGWVALLQSQIK